MPGLIGPAHVPMMPLTDWLPMTTGLSNQRLSKSAALIVNSRVMSATVRSSISLRNAHVSMPRSLMSPNFFDPTCGGVRSSSGCRMFAIRPIHS